MEMANAQSNGSLMLCPPLVLLTGKQDWETRINTTCTILYLRMFSRHPKRGFLPRELRYPIFDRPLDLEPMKSPTPSVVKGEMMTCPRTSCSHGSHGSHVSQ